MRRHFIRGLSLIEVMAALLIFSTVTLGAMTLNGRSIKDSRISLYHTQANLMVTKLINQIRLSARTKAVGAGFAMEGDTVQTAPDPLAPDTIEKQIQSYLNQWTTEALDSLPDAEYQVAWEGVTDPQMVGVTLVWSDEGVLFERDDLCAIAEADLEDGKTCLTVYAKICQFDAPTGDELKC